MNINCICEKYYLGVVTMNQKQNRFKQDQQHHFSIKKFSVGVASVSIGTSILFGIHNDAQASEATATPVVEEAGNIEKVEEAPQPEAVASQSENTVIAPKVETTQPAPITQPENNKAEVAKEVVPEVAPAPKVEKEAIQPRSAKPKAAAKPAAKAANTQQTGDTKYAIKDVVAAKDFKAKEDKKKLEKRPMEFKMEDANTREINFWNRVNTPGPARVVFDGNKREIELTVELASKIADYRLYANDKRLPIDIYSYDKENDKIVMRFGVEEGTKEVLIKSTKNMGDKDEKVADTYLVLAKPIQGDLASYETQGQFEKRKVLEPYETSITLEDKIFQLEKAMKSEKGQKLLKDDMPKLKKKVEELKEALKKELASAKVNYLDAPDTPIDLSQATERRFEVMHSKKPEPSHMDTEIYNTVKLAKKDGKDMVVMTIKHASMWQDFQVDGKHVQTVSRDAAKDERTIMFPYDKTKTEYNGIVKISFPEIGYEGSYHVRIQDKGALDKDGNVIVTKPQVKPEEKPNAQVKPQAKEKPKTQAKPNVVPMTKAVKQNIKFVVNKPGTDTPSVMDGYMVHPAKVYKQDGKTFVEFTLKNPEWWKSFELFAGDKALATEVVADNTDQRVVRVAVEPGTKRLTSKVHIVVPAINYDNHYTTEIVFENGVTAGDVAPNTPKKSEPKQMDHKTPKVKTPDHKNMSQQGGQETPEHPLEIDYITDNSKATQSGKVTQMTTPQGRTNGTSAPASKPAQKEAQAKQLPNTGETTSQSPLWAMLTLVTLGGAALFARRRNKSK